MLRYLLTASLCLFLLPACQVGSSAGQHQTPPVLPGGEMAQDPQSPLGQSLLVSAENLLRQKYPEAGISLTGLQSLSSQVVAGMNYRLVATYTDQQGRSGLLYLTLYRDLEDNTSLSADNYPG